MSSEVQFLDDQKPGFDRHSKLKVVLEMNSGEMVKALVENGIGATAISQLAIAK